MITPERAAEIARRREQIARDLRYARVEKSEVERRIDALIEEDNRLWDELGE